MERKPNRRPAIPEPVAVAVMVANHHICCYCRVDGKHVIFHHTDHNRARKFTIPFTVPEDGDYLLLLINHQNREFDVEVEALVWQ